MMKMFGKKKMALMAALILLAGFSSYEFYTSPITTGDAGTDNPSEYNSLSQANTSAEINLSQGNQEVSAAFYVEAKKPPWKQNDSFYMTIYAAKLAQNTSFPYSDATVTLGNVSVFSNGISELVHGAGSQAVNVKNSSVIANYYMVTPVKTSNSMNVSVTFDVNLVLFSGIYHFSKQKREVNESFALE